MSLNALRRAQEEQFFKIEQERQFESIANRLKKQGLFDKPLNQPKPTFASGGGLLPQVLAHQLRLSVPEKAAQNVRVLDRDFMVRQRLKGTCTGNPMFVGSVTLGSSVSLGKGKWTAGANTVEGATIFSVHKATELMSTAPKHLEDIPDRVARQMVDTSVVEVRGMKFKLMPDPTPGRALAWGGTLAIWGTAAVTLTAARALGIRSVDDVKTVMRDRLTPLGEYVRSSFEPWRGMVPAAADVPAGGSFKDTRFANDIKKIFA